MTYKPSGGGESGRIPKTVYTKVGKVSCFKFDGVTPDPTIRFHDADGPWIRNVWKWICRDHGWGNVRITIEYLGKD